MSTHEIDQNELDENQVIVGRYLDPAEAHMAQGLLESAGLESFLQGENANAMVPMAFRTRLTVRQEDEEAAKALLAGPNLPEEEQADE